MSRVMPDRGKKHRKEEEDIIARPRYTSMRDKSWGGKSATVVLGPTGGDAEQSNADPDLPPAIEEAAEIYGRSSLKAGHLLNESFGGDGQNPENMTILSNSGNSQHWAQFERPTQQALGYLGTVYGQLRHCGIETAGLQFGIRVTVTRSDEGWSRCPAAPDSLTCKAELENIPDWEQLKEARREQLVAQQREAQLEIGKQTTKHAQRLCQEISERYDRDVAGFDRQFGRVEDALKDLETHLQSYLPNNGSVTIGNPEPKARTRQ